MSAVLVAAVTGVFGLLGELLRRESKRGNRDKRAHDDMSTAVEHLTDLVKDTRRDVGGLRGDVRGLTGRVDHLDRQLDAHLERKD